MENIFLGIIFIVTGILMLSNNVIFLGAIEKELHGFWLYMVAFPEIILGFYLFYYEYTKGNKS